MPRRFPGGRPRRQPSPGTRLHSRLSINRPIIQFRRSEPLLPALGMVGGLPKSRCPDASQGRPCAWASRGAVSSAPALFQVTGPMSWRPGSSGRLVFLPGPGMWAVASCLPPGPRRPHGGWWPPVAGPLATLKAAYLEMTLWPLDKVWQQGAQEVMWQPQAWASRMPGSKGCLGPSGEPWGT